MDTLLTVENLKTYFFTERGTFKSVDDVSFQVPRGKTVGIVGESGSGKSVTALSILRLVSAPGRIVGGRVLLSGGGAASGAPTKTIDLLKLPESEMRGVRGGKIAMIFQEPMTSLNPVFTIGDQIEEAVALHQKELNEAQRWEQVLEVLRLVRIPDPERAARSYPHELSGGMRQRAMIAIALGCRPDILIADEPTTALDVTVQAQVLELLRELRERFGMSLILITHDLGVVAEQADEVIVMYAGKIVEQGTVRQIFAHPRHPYTRALLEALPTFHTTGRLRTIPGSVPSLAALPRGCSFQERCDRVQTRCHEEDPELMVMGEGQVARCFFPES